MITLEQARRRIGDAVVYRPEPDRPEEGVITMVNEYNVFVRYGADKHSKATLPGDLEWVRP